MKVKYYTGEMLIVPETEVEEQWIDGFGQYSKCFVKYGLTPGDVVGLLIRQQSKNSQKLAAEWCDRNGWNPDIIPILAGEISNLNLFK